MDDDDRLLSRFAGGDPEAFVAFYRRHLAAILGYRLRRAGDQELTADLAAEVFAAALVAAKRYVLKRAASLGPAAARRYCQAHPVKCRLLKVGSTSNTSGPLRSARSSSTTTAASDCTAAAR